MKPAYACPKCNSTELMVEITDSAELIQHDDGHIETYVSHDATHWDGESTMSCQPCGHQDEANRFRREP